MSESESEGEFDGDWQLSYKTFYSVVFLDVWIACFMVYLIFSSISYLDLIGIGLLIVNDKFYIFLISLSIFSTSDTFLVF